MQTGRTFRRALLLATAGIVVVDAVIALRAQVPATDAKAPAFEVSVIKPTNVTGSAYTLNRPGGRFTAINISLRGLITRAYRLQNNQVEGGANWVDSERFDIEAKAEGNASQTQVLLMLQALLAERFKLRMRNETRQLPIYALVMARSDGKIGSRLRPSSEGDCLKVPPLGGGPPPPSDRSHPFCGVLYTPTGYWTGRGVSMEALASNLARVVSRVVLNRTGLAGIFDMDLQWTDLMALLQPGAPAADAPAPADNPTSIFTALQEQLGLKLESTKGPVDVLVIDHVEQPTPD
jgi:uncharacterized protein (TIGR03435 family)